MNRLFSGRLAFHLFQIIVFVLGRLHERMKSYKAISVIFKQCEVSLQNHVPFVFKA